MNRSITLSACAILLFLFSISANAQTLKGFRLEFDRASLIFDADTRSTSIAVRNDLPVSTEKWDMLRLKKYIFHMRPSGLWNGFFWQINTSRRRVDQISGGEFGYYGGARQPVPAVYSTQKGLDGAPKRFRIDFLGGAKLIVRFISGNPDVSTITLTTAGTRLAHQSSPFSGGWPFGSGWKVKRLRPYLFHMKHSLWGNTGYWSINTSRKTINSISNGKFGELGGTYIKKSGMAVHPLY